MVLAKNVPGWHGAPRWWLSLTSCCMLTLQFTNNCTPEAAEIFPGFNKRWCKKWRVGGLGAFPEWVSVVMHHSDLLKVLYFYWLMIEWRVLPFIRNEEHLWKQVSSCSGVHYSSYKECVSFLKWKKNAAFHFTEQQEVHFERLQC